MKLISDWAKWLITIETAAIAAIGAYLKSASADLPLTVKLLTTTAVVSFVISIAAAALLLLSLPEIAQSINPDRNIWMTRDSVIGQVFRMSTQDFAVIESFFFGVGVVLLATLVIGGVWSSAFRPKG